MIYNSFKELKQEANKSLIQEKTQNIYKAQEIKNESKLIEIKRQRALVKL